MTKPAAVVPLLLGPANCESAIGCSWRWTRDMARTLGIRLVGAGRKQFVPAAAFIEALSRVATASVELAANVVTDPAAAIRAQLGLTLRGAPRGNDRQCVSDPAQFPPAAPDSESDADSEAA